MLDFRSYLYSLPLQNSEAAKNLELEHLIGKNLLYTTKKPSFLELHLFIITSTEC
jgi:hypothetical protein